MVSVELWRPRAITCPAPGCDDEISLTFEEFFAHFRDNHSLNVATVDGELKGITRIPLGKGERGYHNIWDCLLCGAKMRTSGELWSHLVTYHGCS